MLQVINKIPNWFRWLLIPIVSVIAAVLVGIGANIAAKVLIFFMGERGFLTENFYQYLIIPGVAGYCSITAAVIVAPRFNKIIAIVLGSIWIFLAGALTFLAIINDQWTSLIAIASLCIGCTISALEPYDETRHLIPDQES
jgi:hypothetical protein